MGVNITDSCLCVLLVLLLLPPFGAVGYVILLYISEIINFAASIVRLYNTVGFKIDLLRFVALPLACVIFAVSAANFITPGTGVAAMVAKIAFSALIYASLLFALGCFDREDRRWMRSIIRQGERAKNISENIFAKK